MLFFFLFLQAASPSSESWQWPINTDFGTTSSFGEYRGLRFHMGLDFSTGGVEGQKIWPAKSGTIYQIRANRRGYGRVLYVRHKGGYTTVYAHLAAFGPTIKKYLQEKGKNPSSYFGRLQTDIPVSAKTLLAYSGESGAGLPHLHFEVRDAQNRALDPLALDFPKLANLGKKVHFEGITLIPKSAASRVNGQTLPFVAEASDLEVQASGTFDIQVSGYIKGVRSSRLGLRGIEVTWNDELIGKWVPRRIDYKQHRTAGAIFDQSLSGFGPTRFNHCFGDRHEDLPSPTNLTIQKPLLVLEKGQLKIALMDQQGTWHRYKMLLDPQATRLARPAPQLKATQATSLTLVGFQDQLQAMATGSAGELVQGPDKGTALEDGDIWPIPLNPGNAANTFIWRTATGNLSRLIGTLPAEPRFSEKLGVWRIEATQAQPAKIQAVWLEPANKKALRDSMEALSPMLRFGREGLPVKGVSISIAIDAFKSPQELGIYAFSKNSGSWRWKSSGKHTIKYSIDTFQPVILARDIVPPSIERPKMHAYFIGKRIVIRLKDSGSGIDSKSIWVRNQQGSQSFEYDHDRRWIVLPPNAKGPWQVGVQDRAGHQTVRKGLNL